VVSRLRRSRMLRSSVLGIGASVSIGTFALLGCGGEKSETPSAPVVVEEIWTTALPEGFPQDVPQYPAAEVVKANSTLGSGLKATFSTSDDVGKVASFFNDAFAAQGWSTERADRADGTLVFADKDERSATVGISSAEGKTQIELLVIEMR